jgi:hypothetical protein
LILASLAILSGLAFGQASTSAPVGVMDDGQVAELRERVEKLELEVKGFQSGRSTTTAYVTSLGSMTFTRAGSGVCFSDGTCFTSADVSAGAVYYSSFSAIVRGNATNTILGVCRATVTFTTHGCSVLVMATASLKGVGGAKITAAGFLVDGAFPSGLNNTTGVTMCGSFAEDVHCPVFAPYEVRGLSAASHTFCFTPAVNSASTGVCATDTFTDSCKFGVVEICE